VWLFNLAFGKIFVILFWPLRGLSPWFALILVSFLTGLMMLLIFRRASNQDGIRREKNRIKAHLLEIRLFKDSLGQSLRSQGKLFAANFRYIGYALKPMLIMVIPVMLILLQLDLWFGSRPLRVGESALVKVELKEGPIPADIELKAPAGLIVDSPALRIPEESEIDWRIRAISPGLHSLLFRLGHDEFSKAVTVAPDGLARVSALKPGRAFFEQMFHPGESPLPGFLPVRAVEVVYPARRMSLFGWRMHWLVAFIGLSIVFGFSFKGVFKVEI
jgi:hypothetical protein